MAKRRSSNRRWSRRSGNLTDYLDQHSNFVDSHNALWWKEIQDDMTARPSGLFTNANSTVNTLVNDSSTNISQLKDEWWKDLDKSTTQELPKNISTHKNQDDTRQDTSHSESEDSIKKPKVLLRTKRKKSEHTDLFQKVMNDSSATVHSEPVVNKKRKSKSYIVSDTEALYKKTKHQSRSSQGISRDNQYVSLNSSNDTDIILKTRGNIMKKLTQQSNSEYNEILDENRADSSEIHSTEHAIQSFHSSGKTSMRPRTTYLNSNSPGSVSRDTATILTKSKSFDLLESRQSLRNALINEEQSKDNKSNDKSDKRRGIFLKKSTNNESVNVFDDILSGYSKDNNLMVSNTMVSHAGLPIKDVSNVTEDNSHRLISKSNHEIPLIANQTKESAASNVSSVSTKLVQNLEPNKNSTIHKEAIDDAEMPQPSNITRSSKSLPKKNSLDSKHKTGLNEEKTQLIPISESNLQNQRNLSVPATENNSEDEECVDKARNSFSESPYLAGSFKRGFRISRILSSTKIVHSVQTGDSEGTTEEEEVNVINKMPISVRRSRIITEASYDLPNDERSSSIVPSTPEREIDSITEDSRAENQLFDKSKNPSLLQNRNESLDKVPNQLNPVEEGSHTSTNNNVRLNISMQHADSDISISEDGTPIVEAPNRLSEKNSQMQEENIESRKSIPRATKSQRPLESDSTSSNEEPKIRRKLSRKSIKSSQTLEMERRSSKKANTSRQQVDSDATTVELDVPVMQKSNPKSMRDFENKQHAKRSEQFGDGGGEVSRVRQRIESDTDSTSEENSPIVEKSTRKSKRISRAEKSSNASKKDDSWSNRSPQGIEPEADVSEEENSPTIEKLIRKTLRDSHVDPQAKRSVKRVSGNTKNVNTFRQRIQSDADSTSNENSPIVEKSTRKSKRISRAEKSSNASKKDDSWSNRSPQGIEPEADVSEAENSPTIEKSIRKTLRNSHVDPQAKRSVKRVSGDTKKVNTSRQRIQSDIDSTSEENSSIIKNPNQKSKRISRTEKAASTSGKSFERGNKSVQRIEFTLDRTNEDNLPIAEKSNRRSKKILHTEEVADATVNNTPRGGIPQRRIEWNNSDSEEYLPLIENSPKKQKTSMEAPLSSNNEIPISTNNGKLSFTAGTSERDISTSISAEIPIVKELPIPRDKRSMIPRPQRNIPQTQTNITNFLTSTNPQKVNESKASKDLETLDKEKWNLIKRKMEKIKNKELLAMKIQVADKNKPSVTMRSSQQPTKAKFLGNKATATTQVTKPLKAVDKAYIVNGKVYKRPKLPRPKPWVTDRLYRHLWKRMEGKFGLSTRIKSEKFVEQLSEVVDLTTRRKKYESYKLEVDALMKEMARLGIIVSRNDFYDFCYDFLPYAFRVKVTPILLPGNVQNIPYDPKTLYTPIIEKP